MKNMISHMFRKDVRHLRILLGLWFMLIVLQAALSGSGWMSRSDNLAWGVAFEMLAWLVPVLQFIVILVLVPMLVHDEPLVGTTAFWFTRPVARRTLLKEKALFAGALIVLPPLAAEMIVLAANGISIGPILSAIPEILLERCAGVLTVAVLAVFTPNFARFAIIGVSFLVASMLIGFLMQMISLFWNPEKMMDLANRYSMLISRQLIVQIVTLAFGVAVVINQYLRRDTRRSIAITAIGFVIYLAVSGYWPWDFMASPRREIAPDVIDPAAVGVELSGRSIGESFSFGLNRKDEKSISAGLEITGMPPGYVAEPENLSSVLRFEDGTAIESEIAHSFFSTGSMQDQESIERAMEPLFVLNGENHGTTYRNVASMTQEEYDRYAGETAVLELQADFKVYRYERAAILSLEKQAAYEDGPRKTAIIDILRRSTGCTVIMRERSLTLDFKKNTYPDSVYGGAFGNIMYVLANAERKEAFLPEDRDHDFSFAGQNQRLRVRNQHVSFTFDDVDLGLSSSVEEWLDGAEIYILQKRYVGVFRKSFTNHDFAVSKGTRHYSSSSRKGPDVEVLEKITLPEHPTRDDIKQYVQSILAVSRRQNSYSSRDPQIDMLVEIGSEHLDILLENSRERSFYIVAAARRLAGPEHRELILKHLYRLPELVSIVVKEEWTPDARDILVKGLSYKEHLPTEWIRAVASFRDSDTYDNLIRYFVQNGYQRGDTYDAIKDLPGIALDEAVEKAWKRAKASGHSEYEYYEMLPVAIEAGYLDALDIGARTLGDEDAREWNKRAIRKALKEYVEFDGSMDDFPEWYDAHKKHIVFSEEDGRYRIRP